LQGIWQLILDEFWGMHFFGNGKESVTITLVTGDLSMNSMALSENKPCDAAI
jgi:hypothetical protein